MQTTSSAQFTDAVTASRVLDGYNVAVRVSTRRLRLGVTVEPGGDHITVAVPAGISPSEAIGTLTGMRDRILRAVAKARETPPSNVVRQLTHGETFQWLGRPVTLELVDDDRPVHLDDKAGRLVAARHEIATHRARPLIGWYCTEGTRWLDEQADTLWPLMAPSGARPPLLRVFDIGRTRWGKYEPGRHRATLAWQTMQLPHHLARYVIAHELAHATRPSGLPHGPAFWRAAERGMPGAQQARTQLNAMGHQMWTGDAATADQP